MWPLWTSVSVRVPAFYPCLGIWRAHTLRYESNACKPQLHRLCRKDHQSCSCLQKKSMGKWLDRSLDLWPQQTISWWVFGLSRYFWVFFKTTWCFFCTIQSPLRSKKEDQVLEAYLVIKYCDNLWFLITSGLKTPQWRQPKCSARGLGMGPHSLYAVLGKTTYTPWFSDL